MTSNQNYTQFYATTYHRGRPLGQEFWNRFYRMTARPNFRSRFERAFYVRNRVDERRRADADLNRWFHKGEYP